MNTQSRKHYVDRPTEERCCHLSPSGRRCRSARSSPDSSLCTRHRAGEQAVHSADLAPDLTARLTDIRASLQTVEGLHNSLAELYILLTQNRVSARRAAVLAYVSGLLLRSLPSEKDSSASARTKPPVQIVWDLPRPARENPNTPELQDNTQQLPKILNAASVVSERSAAS